MNREEVEFLPESLVSCFIDERAVRVLKISPEKLVIRLLDKIEEINLLKLAFYNFKEDKYNEIVVKEFIIAEIIEKEFYYEYKLIVTNKEYFNNVRKSIRDYSQYAIVKNYGYENQFSEDMVAYPAVEDYDYSKNYIEQKKSWIEYLNYEIINSDVLDNIELAIKLDNYDLYKSYLNNSIEEFLKQYYKNNFIENHILSKKKISRLYIGNEFCHNLFPSKHILKALLNKANKENLAITLCFTYMRDCYIENIKYILDMVNEWCKENGITIEIIVNDWGMVKLLENTNYTFNLSLGVLLNKRKKDPRYKYKNSYNKYKEILGENSLNSEIFSRFLNKKNVIRYEYESCGYKMHIAEGKHSLQIPFYVTNTSQYCTLHAMCENLDRGKQKLVKNCKMYCRDYFFAYAKHLNMVGRYNSLFAFDKNILKDFHMLEDYINDGIDRIVLNFI